jgi:hypothetical protein
MYDLTKFSSVFPSSSSMHGFNAGEETGHRLSCAAVQGTGSQAEIIAVLVL